MKRGAGSWRCALRLRGDEVLIDAGGGLGVLAQLLLARYPQLRGRERTAAELAALLGRAGFALERMTHLPALPSVIAGQAR
jgi:hypothetical protein